MSSLFDSTPPPPLAEALRPKSIHEVIGQTHLLAEGKPLQLAFSSGKPHSMILWGPPGVGKTEFAKIYADIFVRLGVLKTDKFIQIKYNIINLIF